MKFVRLTLLLLASSFFSFGQSFETKISGNLSYDYIDSRPITRTLQAVNKDQCLRNQAAIYSIEGRNE
jgi:hypothetical protein